MSKIAHCEIMKLKNNWGRIENGIITCQTEKNLFAAVNITLSLRGVKPQLSYYINIDDVHMVSFNLIYIYHIL